MIHTLVFLLLFVVPFSEGAPPSATISPTSPEVKEGEALVLSCNATGSPTLDVQWIKDGSAINASADSRITISTNGTQLTITNLTRTDNGPYRCVANNSEGNSTSDPATLTVLYGPEFTTHPESVTKKEGVNATLSCSATGKPTPHVKWTKDATDINADSRITIFLNGTQLTITNVTRTDDGLYRCVANNSVGNRTSNPATLTVLYGPVFTTQPQNEIKKEGRNVTLSCNATGNPTPDVKWTRQNSELNASADSRIAISQGGKQLTITNVIRTDDGLYRCVAKNSEGNLTSDPATLTVQYGPEFTTHPESVTKKEGVNATLSCSATGKPTPHVKWTKDATDINADSRITIFLNGTQLTITNVTRTDDGLYRCVANNSVGNRTSNPATLTVDYTPSAEISSTSPVVKEGGAIAFSCNATGSPTPEIEWTKDGSVINASADSRVSISQDGTQLNITNVTRRDDGLYRCVANNSEGNITSDAAKLTVLYKPSATISPTLPVLIEGGAVTFSCNATGSPTLEIEWTKGESAINASADSRVTISNNGTQLTITDLTRTDSGQYRCVANNSEGIITSDPATLTVQFEPEISSHPENVTKKEGQSVVINCTVKGLPRPDVTWTKDETALELASPRLNVSSSGEVYGLIINNIMRSDDGIYRCEANNSVSRTTSYPGKLTVLSVPDPPETVTVDSRSSRTVNISWTDGFDGNSTILDYKVRISEDTGQTWIDVSCQGSSAPNICNVSVTSASLKELSPATTYHIQVIARNQVGLSGPSSVVNVTTDEAAPSAAPENVQGHNTSSTSILVTWDEVPAADRNGIIVSYTVFYQSQTENDAGSKSANGSTLQLELTGLKEYVNYNITVLATTMKGDGPPSNVTVVTTDQDRPTAAPENVSGHNTSSTSISVMWGDVPAADRNGIIESYTVSYRSQTENDNGSETVGSSQHKLDLTDLKKYVNYNISVLATTVKGDGPSMSIFVTTDQDTPSAGPDNVQGHNTSSTSILVTWGEVPAPHKNGIIVSYTVSYQSQTENDAGSKIVNGSTLQLELTGLKEYVNYDITVVAATVKGNGSASNVIVVTTDQDTPSAAPANVAGRNTSSTSILVTWQVFPTADRNGIIVGYTVSYQSQTENDDGSKSVNGSTLQLELSRLKEYVNYNITVLATTVKGNGPASNATFVTTDQDTPSAAPANVQGHNTSSTSILVTWDEVPAADRNGIIVSYTVFYQSQTENDTGSKIAPNRQFNLTGLKEYVNYNITVLATTVKGNGPASNATFVTTDQDTPSAAPANVQGHNTSSTSILVTWDEVPAADRNGIIVSYTVFYQSQTENDTGSKIAPNRQFNLTGLKEYVNYNITVLATTVKGNGPASNAIVVITDQDKPSAAPANVQGHNTSSTSILVTWDEVPAADRNGIIVSYTVFYQSQTENDAGSKIAPNRQFNLTGLKEYVNYNITVLATTVKGNGPASNATFVTTDQDKPSAAPANVQGHNTSSTSILVTWDEVPTADRNGIIMSYTVFYQSQTENDAGSKIAPNRQFNLTGLKEYVNYNITVLATTVKGNGPASNATFVTTDQDKPSAAPANVQGHNTSSTSILVTWDEVPTADRNGIIMSYTVFYQSQTENDAGSKIAPNRQFNLTGLKEYVNYNITVLATTVKGNGPASNATFVTTDQDKPSAAPANVQGRNTSSTSILVTWDEVPTADRNGIIMNYTVFYQSQTENDAGSKIAPNRQFNLTGLKEYVNYNITVLATTVKGNGPASNATFVTTDQDTPSTAPATVQGHNTSSTSILVTWDEVPAEDRNGIIVSYTVFYQSQTENDAGSKIAPNRQFNLTGLKEYVNYNITVLATTVKGNGPASNAIFVITDQDTPSTAPATVQGHNTSSTSILVTWDEVPAEDRNGIIVSYTVFYQSQTENDAGSKIAPNRQFNLTGLKEYVNYNITVLATTVKGNGPASNAIFVITDQDTPSAAPVNVEGHNTSSTSILVTWEVVPEADRNGIIVSYFVIYQSQTENHAGSKSVNGSTLQLELTALKEFVNYDITVVAATVKGNGTASNVIVVTTDQDKPSGPPENVRETASTSTSILIAWDEMPAAERNGIILSYNVSYRIESVDDSRWINVSAREANLTDLVKNMTYLINVSAITVKGAGPFSDHIRALTDQDKPTAAPNNVQGHNTSSTRILVTWGEVPEAQRNGIIESYTVIYQSQTESHNGSETVDAPTLERELTGLKKYVNYNITVLATTVIGNGPASNVIIVTTAQDEPSAPPQNIKGEYQNSTSILVTWDEVPGAERNGIILSYTVSYQVNSGGEVTTQRIDAPVTRATLTDLAKYTEYSITVLATTVKGDGPPTVAIVVTTDQDIPSEAPQNIRLEVKNTTTILVKWDEVPSQFRHGIITGYKILYKAEGSVATKSTSGRSGTLTGLSQFTTYTIQVLAVTAKGDGKKSEPQSAQTEAPPTLAPPSEENIGKTEASVPLVNKETLANGEKTSHVQMIVILLEEGGDPGNSGEERYKPKNLQGKSYKEDLKPGDLYIAAEFSYGVVKDSFPLGDGKKYSRSRVTEANRRRRRRETGVTSYLNGALQDGAKYAVFQRSFDAGSYYENEGFITFTTAKDYTAVIVGAVVAVVLVLVIVAVAVFIWRRRQARSDGRDDEGISLKEKTRGRIRTLTNRIRRPHSAAFDNHVPGEPVPVEEFDDHVRRLHANGDLLFSQEYGALRPDGDFTWNATLAQENRFKNRYNNIVAYDHSRVLLSPVSEVPGSDYINANYLDGYRRKKAYIATQGPLEETTEDFWRMVWEQGTRTIVMVTNCEENRRIKCFQYWPSEGGQTHGDIQVTLTETVQLSDYTIRTLTLKRANSNSSRTVHQYHFTSWPDHGVPRNTTTMLTFVRKVASSNPPDVGPMVVHCSAGVGRTGTFVVVEAMLQRISTEKSVDVYGYVLELRKNRNIMVQVEEQYIFIHEVLLEAIHSGYTEIKATDLRIYIRNLMEINPTDGQSEMDKEFIRLGRGSNPPQTKFQSANMPYNKTKNRYANVLPFDDSRVRLSVLTGIEGSDYINGNFIDGYMMKGAFIATQAPIPDTIPDFWRMIWEQESATVVMLSNETESGKVKVHRYWPGKQPASIGTLVVEMTNEMPYEDYIMREIKLTNTKESASRVVRQYHYTGWPDVGSPDSGTGLIDLIGQVQRWQQTSGNTTSVVHCSAGVGRTGVFCALSVLIERLKSEGVVDVFQTVKQLRAQRPAMVQTKDQYEFIYHALKEYLDSFETYSNFM